LGEKPKKGFPFHPSLKERTGEAIPNAKKTASNIIQYKKSISVIKKPFVIHFFILTLGIEQQCYGRN
jgi:hypothetical protein